VTILIPGLIIFFSALVQGATSFGFSLIALPLLGLVLDLKNIVPMLVLFSLFMNIIILIRLKRKPHIKALLMMFIVAVIFTPIGVQILKVMDESILKIFIGILLIVVAILLKRGYRVHIQNEKLTFLIAGVLSGIFNGSVSISGPPIVVMLSNNDTERDLFRISLTTYFLLLNIITVFLYFNGGLLSAGIIKSYLGLIPFLIGGTIAGTLLGSHIDEVKFKNVVLNLLVVMGIMNLF
jgi:uncharacterized membrane protein YfcA